MRATAVVFFSSVAVGALSFVVACSSSPESDPTAAGGSAAKGASSSSGSSSGKSSSSSGASSTSSSSSSSSSSGSTSSSSSSGSSSGGQQDCSKTADIAACFDCVAKENMAAAQKDETLYFNCVCAATACATECAQSDCSTNPNAPLPTPGDACDQCENSMTGKGYQCGPQSDQQCNADPTCAPFLQAAQKANCNNKPAPNGADGGA